MYMLYLGVAIWQVKKKRVKEKLEKMIYFSKKHPQNSERQVSTKVKAIGELPQHQRPINDKAVKFQ